MNIAVMPGDGVGKEVVPEGLKVLKAAAEEVRLHLHAPPTTRSAPSTTSRPASRCPTRP